MLKVSTETESRVKKLYRFHGVLLEGDGNEGVAECPFCGKEKFHVAMSDEDGRFNCKVCGVSGNPIQFLRHLHKNSLADTRSWEWIESHRGINPSILERWGVALSLSTKDWVVPGYGSNGKLNQLYRYCREPGSDKYRLLATPTLSHGMFGPLSISEDSEYTLSLEKEKLYITEGCWDGMVLWGKVKDDADVISVPGCNVFHESWSQFTEDKSVTLPFDNDHPDKQGRCAGFEGVKHAVGVMTAGDERPKDISYLYWGEKGYDESKPNGYDIRDMFASGVSLEEVLAMVKSVPNEWIGSIDKKPVFIETMKCENWKELRNQWRISCKFILGMERALLCSLASISSVKFGGEQLWLKCISPPSSGKTMICEALGVARKYTVCRSSFNGFYSGYKTDKEGAEDHSLITKLANKTLITKDGDTLLQSEWKHVILSQARDLYDGPSRKSYNNSLTREYDQRMTWLLFGTPALRELDRSELGQRFLDVVIMDEIDMELEKEMVRRAVRQQLRNSKVERNCKPETTDDPDYLKAKRMTGGYIEYLRKHSVELVNGITEPDWAIDMCESLGTFVAFMRARDSSSQEDDGGRELGMRLGKQLFKLTQFLTVVMNKKSIDKEVMRIVKQTALDTARGRTLKIVGVLAESKGMDTQTVAQHTNQNSLKEAEYLRFMRKIRVVELWVPPGKPALKAKWRLTRDFERVYREVVKP